MIELRCRTSKIDPQERIGEDGVLADRVPSRNWILIRNDLNAVGCVIAYRISNDRVGSTGDNDTVARDSNLGRV